MKTSKIAIWCALFILGSTNCQTQSIKESKKAPKIASATEKSYSHSQAFAVVGLLAIQQRSVVPTFALEPLETESPLIAYNKRTGKFESRKSPLPLQMVAPNLPSTLKNKSVTTLTLKGSE